MQTFVSIVDAGSLTAAAAALGSSLPTVVRNLAALEAHLGVRLLRRSTRRLALTEEGKLYLESCRHVLAALGEAESALTQAVQEPSGHLTITAPVLFGQMVVAPAVTQFVQRYPKIHCQVLLLDRVVNLLEEGIDVGVRIGPLQDSSLVAQSIGSVRRMVVASPDYLRRVGTPQHPSALLAANCVLHSANSGSRWTFYAQGKKFAVNVAGNLSFNHIAPAIDACVAGAGFGLFISYQVAPALKSKSLRLVLEEFEPPLRPVSVVYPHARLLPGRTRLLIDWIKQAAAEQKPPALAVRRKLV